MKNEVLNTFINLLSTLENEGALLNELKAKLIIAKEFELAQKVISRLTSILNEQDNTLRDIEDLWAKGD
jgi:hypothetical protein